MSQTIAIIVSFTEAETQRFEQLFAAEILPMWVDFKAQGKFLAASLTPVEGGSEEKQGIRNYILHVAVPGLAEHEEFDSAAPFLEFLKKVKPMQPAQPKVWFGTPLFQV
jgi:hypothetical protein